MSDPSIEQARQHYHAGQALLRDSRFAEALEQFRRATELAPQSTNSLNGMAVCYRNLGELEKSIAAFARMLAIAPSNATGYHNLAVSLQDQGKLDEALEAYRRSLVLLPAQPAAWTNMLLCMSYHDSVTPAELFAAYREYAGVFEPAAQSASAKPRLPSAGLPSAGLPSAGHRIHIGYLSPDFRGHSVSFFIWPVLSHHDRSRFCVTCYSDAAAPDAVTDLMKRTPERWRETARLSDDQLAQLIAEDGIDILVDLAGQTPGNRLPLLARRVAPVQATYLGCPNTTGLSAIDYRITDAVQDPPGMSETIHSEQLVRLPPPWPFFTQVTVADMPEVSPLPAMALATKRVTFAVFTNFCKVRPMMMTLWARILREVPQGRLLIQARSLRDRATREMVLRHFQDQGIDPARLELREFVEFPQYVEQYREVDIVLDTYPFNGHTTTCQALWMGAPLVTLAGQVSRSRMGASILTAIGLPELIARSEEEYVRIAADLASDLPRLAALRAELRQRVAQSPILDGAGFTRALEAAYVEMIGKLAPNG